MKYKFYFFDFDYTLVNSEKGIVGCFVRSMMDCGFPVPDYDVIKATIGMPIEDAVAQLTGLSDDEEIKRVLYRYSVHADEIMTPNTYFYPDTIALLEKIKAEGGRAAIISTKTCKRISDKFRNEGREDLIEMIIGRENCPTCKPNPEGIFMAMKAMGAEKENTIYIGDSLFDAGAAKNAGIAFAAVLTGSTLAEEFANYPSVQIMNSLSELE